MKKIVVTGGTGRFGNLLKNHKTKYEIFFPNKEQLNILSPKNIKNYLAKKKPDILIHLAGLSRPMKLHEIDIKKSIDLNIIGTANITKACSEKKIKLAIKNLSKKELVEIADQNGNVRVVCEFCKTERIFPN